MIRAGVAADSISEQGKPLLTFKLRYPWFIHGELMTHRVLSRNASSNRAIPVARMIAEARSEDRAAPVFWGAEQKGMQTGGELLSAHLIDYGNSKECAQNAWRNAAYQAAAEAERMVRIGLHKSIINRILQPFTHARVVVTATEWDNFFGLRLHRDAEPTMRALAVAMWEARKASTPKLLRPGEWHLPFIDSETLTDIGRRHTVQKEATHEMIRVSVARCARVSYESHETGRRSTVEEDLALYERLVGSMPLHASPAEHQATPDTFHKGAGWTNFGQHGNFVGWRQYRKMLPGEAVAPLPEGYAP